MEMVLETIMDVLLDTAMLILILHLVRTPDGNKKGFRFASITFAVGFAFGIVAKCIEKGTFAAVILYALGFMLAYTAFLFTLPERGTHDEKH